MRSQRLGRGWRLALVGLLALAGPAGADNWPRFRGPNGTGMSADKDVPVKWNLKENVLWQVPVPGVGNGSPVVWGDRLYLQASSADGTERSLSCLDARNGKTLWKQTIPAQKAPAHKFNSLASSTPAIDGERVYAFFWDGNTIGLYAYTLDGKPVWKRNLGGWTSQHGPGHSPMVHDGRVFLLNDQDGTSVLVALHAKTGETAWEAPRKPFRSCYSTPFVLDRPDGTTELIVTSTAGISGCDPKTGKENWSYTWHFTGMALRTVASSVAANGVVFAASGDGSGARHFIAVKLGGQGDVTGTNLLWETRKKFPYVPCMLAQGNFLFTVNDEGLAGCYQGQTGEEVWSQRLIQGRGGVTASPILVDGKIVVVDDDGEVYVLEAGPEFKLIARNSLKDPVSATPAVADGKLYIRGRNNLFCIGKRPAQ
jgi:outer membrane protein assembly factor BamB